MFTLRCEITIEKKDTSRADRITFTSVHSIEVKRSIYDLGATATIKIPMTAVLRQSGKPATHIETPQMIDVEDKITISMGYDMRMVKEFVGYVKQINHKKPLEIECEDEFYKVRSTPCTFSAKTATLKECLAATLPDVKIGHCTNLTLKNFVVDNNGQWLLSELKKEYGLTIFFDVDNKLYVGKAFEVATGRAKYRMGYNVIKNKDLKFKQEKDKTLLVKAICYYKDGRREQGEAGKKGGEEKTLYYYDVENQEELKLLAQEEYSRYIYDGYEGKMETFLAPAAFPAMVAEIEDPDYPERTGSYYIESTTTTFGAGGDSGNSEGGAQSVPAGGRRTIAIGRKV